MNPDPCGRWPVKQRHTVKDRTRYTLCHVWADTRQPGVPPPARLIEALVALFSTVHALETHGKASAMYGGAIHTAEDICHRYLCRVFSAVCWRTTDRVPWPFQCLPCKVHTRQRPLHPYVMGRTRYTNPWIPEGHTHVNYCM
jgi:hypothetical protein